MSDVRQHYDAIRQAKDALELKRDALLAVRVNKRAMDEVPIEDKEHATSCADQYGHIIDEMSDLIAALQAELDNIDDQGGPEECEHAMAQEMKMDIARES
jgi:hypothetical protein